MTIEEKQDIIVEEFEMFDDWMDRYAYLIDLGKELEEYPEDKRTDSYILSGCQSQVWLFAEDIEGKIIFKADSDAIITKGIVNTLVRVFSGHTPDEILNAKMDYLDKIGLKQHLSPTRANGLNSMIKQIKIYAMAFKAKQ